MNDLVLRLDKNRFNVIFFFLGGDAGERNSLREAGYEVVYLSNAKKLSAFRLSVLSRLAKILKQRRVDVLHCHAHKATIYGTVAGALAGTPVVLAHVHGLGRSRNLRRKLTNLVLFRKVQRIICVADSVKQDVLRNNWHLSAEKMSVLENSVDYDRFADVSISKADARRILGLPSDALVFGTVGRLAPTKGLSYLIAAFSKVRAQKPSAHLVLLGEGPCRAELEQQASGLPCRDSTHFLGYKGDIEQILRAMDVFVLSSVAEGMPRVILEAMASGVPCIATAVGGIPEIIHAQNVGRLVPPRNADALAEAMITFADAPEEELEGLVDKAKERVRTHFSHDVVASRLGTIYEARIGHCRENGKTQTRGE